MDSMREAKMVLPMEKLFLQILEEKKKSIIQQVKHQIDLFDHHLASKCLLQGIPPPPWLFPNQPSLSSTELQKEDIISGLLLPRANLYNGTQFSEKAPSIDNAALPTSFCTEVCGEKASVCVDRLSVLPKLRSGAPSVLNGVMEVDLSVASPQVCADAEVFEKSDADHIQSLARIQRSKSRQRALEHRSSAKRATMCPRDASDPCISDCQTLEPDGVILQFGSTNNLELIKAVEASNSMCLDEVEKLGQCSGQGCCADNFKGNKHDGFCTEVSGEKSNACVDRLSILPQLGTSGAPCVLKGVMEMDVIVASPQVCSDAEVFEKSDADHIRSLAGIQRSKSRQQELEPQSSAKRATMCPQDASDPCISDCQTLEPDGVTLQFGSTNGLELIKAVEASSKMCVDDVEKLAQCHDKGCCADDFKGNKHDGFCTEVSGEKSSVFVDSLSVSPQLGTSGAPCVLNRVMEMDVSVASPQVCPDAEVFEKRDADHIQSMARIQRSKSRQRALEHRSSAKRATMCPRDASDPCISGWQTLEPDGVILQFGSTNNLELIKAVEASNSMCVDEVEKLGQCSGQGCCADNIKGNKHDGFFYTEVSGEKSNVCVDRLSVLPQLGTSGAPCVLEGVMEMDVIVASPQVSSDAEVFEKSDADHIRSLAAIQRSKSRQQDLRLQSSAKRATMCPQDASDPCISDCQTLEPDGVTLQFGSTNGLELIKVVEASSRMCVDEVEKLGQCNDKGCCADDFKGNKHDTSIDTCEIMGVGSSGPLPNSVKELSGVNSSSCSANRSALPRTCSIIATETQEARKSNGGDEWSKRNRNGRTTRSGSVQQPNHANDYLSLDTSRGSGKVEENMCECRSKEEYCDANCGRIERSVCSNGQIMSVSKPGNASACYCTGKEDGSAEDFGGSIQQPHHIHELLERTKPSAIADFNCNASKTSIGVVKSEEMTTSSDSRGIVRLDSSRPSSEPLQPLGLAGRECVELQAELASKIDVPPSSAKGECVADLRICDAAVDFDGEVLSGSRPPSGCAMLVKPKLLDFDEECSFRPSSLLEKINQRMSSEDHPSALLHCKDLLDNIVSNGHQEDPNSYTETPVLEDHELANNYKKSLNESSEALVNKCPFLIDENTIGYVQKNFNFSASLNQLEGMSPMGSWPQPESTKMGDQLNAAVSSSPKLPEFLQADNSNIRMSPDEDIQNYKFCSRPQHECAKMRDQLKTGLSASPRLMKKLSNSLQADSSNIRISPVKNIQVNEKLQIEEGLELSSQKLQLQQVDPSLEERDMFAGTTYTPIKEPFGLLLESSLPIRVSLDDNQTSLCRESGLDLGFSELLTDSGKNMQESKSREGMNGNLSHFSISPLQEKSKDLTAANGNTPEFEGFLIGGKDEQPHITDFDTMDLSITAFERASLVEQLCKSACLHKSLSHFSTTYMNFYQSVPNGLLEGMELRSPINVNVGIMEQFAASPGCSNEEVNSFFRGGSQSECLPLSSGQSPWDIKKPYLSPSGKLWDRITSKSGSSEKRASSIPDLPCINEENENIDEVVDTYKIAVCTEAMTSGLKREPLADVTESTHPPTSVYEAEKHDDRHSVASVSTEFSFAGTCKRTRPKHENQTSNKRRYISSQKENQGISLELNGVKRDTRSLRNRLSKPQLSVKPSLRKEGPSLSTRDPKRNNIVSDVTSFIPLLQQKQEAEANKGKREVKLKSLEAAELARRRDEKKEHEKKMQKEARIAERARIGELEKVRKEEERKRKEEAHKKKDAEFAAKKRQREEEERKEKERKKKRVDETSKQQVKNKEKLHADKEQKELKFKATELKGKCGKHVKRDQLHDEDNIQKSESETTTKALLIDNKTTIISPEECGALRGYSNALESETTTKALLIDNKTIIISPEEGEALRGYSNASEEVRYLCNPTESDKLTSNVLHEPSYDISPYKGSDDEDEEEDDISNAKFIPSWGSKKNVAVLLASQQRIDPLSIFSLENFYNITEALLLPRKFQAK